MRNNWTKALAGVIALLLLAVCASAESAVEMPLPFGMASNSQNMDCFSATLENPCTLSAPAQYTRKGNRPLYQSWGAEPLLDVGSDTIPAFNLCIFGCA